MDKLVGSSQWCRPRAQSGTTSTLLLASHSSPLVARLAEALLAFLDRRVDVLFEVRQQLIEGHLVPHHLL